MVGWEYWESGIIGWGDDTAQVTPKEVVEKMLGACGAEVVLGECVGIGSESVELESSDDDDKGDQQVKGVQYIPRGKTEEQLLKADIVVVSAGPWSC